MDWDRSGTVDERLCSYLLPRFLFFDADFFLSESSQHFMIHLSKSQHQNINIVGGDSYTNAHRGFFLCFFDTKACWRAGPYLGYVQQSDFKTPQNVQ